MRVQHFNRTVSSRGDTQVHDLTAEVLACLGEAKINDGLCAIFVPGSTAGLTTIEHEPGVVNDLQACFARLAPEELDYAHERAWHDGNGHSHVRAGLLGPSLTVPVQGGQPALGTWQQIVLIDFDNKSRQRRYVITVLGE